MSGRGVTILPDPFINRFQNIIHPELHIEVVEPQKTNAEIFRTPLPCSILRISKRVACAIYFNGKEQLWTKEIHHKLINWLLPVEVISSHLFSFELIPQQYLRQCAIIAEVPCHAGKLSIVSEELSFHVITIGNTHPFGSPFSFTPANTQRGMC